MRDEIERRLEELQGEYESGQRLHAELSARLEEVRSDLLRIAGAIQVLREVLAGDEPSTPAHEAPQAIPVAASG